MLRHARPLLRHLGRCVASYSPLQPHASSNGFVRKADHQPRRGLASWFGDGACPSCGTISSRISADDPPSGARQLLYSTPSTASAFVPGTFAPSVISRPRQVIRSWSDGLIGITQEELFQLGYENPLEYFKKVPLLVKAPEASDKLHVLLPQILLKPWKLTEPGKFSLHSLKDLVINSHKEGFCLGSSLRLENLIMSSIGTFKMKQIKKTKVTPDGQIEDFATLKDTIVALIEALYGPEAIANLSDDFGDYLSLLGTVKHIIVDSFIIATHPSLMPISSYGMAILKMYWFFMEEGCGIMHTDNANAKVILQGMPYQDAANPLKDWTVIASTTPWLAYWYDYIPGRYDIQNCRHMVLFIRHIISHVLGFRHLDGLKMAANAPAPNANSKKVLGPVTPYLAEAVYLLLQDRYPMLLPYLIRRAAIYCDTAMKFYVMEEMFLSHLFLGSSPCYVK